VLSDGGDGGPLRWPGGDRYRRRVRIGAATARAFAAEGARVSFADVDGARPGGGRRDAGVFEAAMSATAHGARAGRADGRGLRRVDVLISNAFATSVGSDRALRLEAWTRTLEVTLTAAFTGLQGRGAGMRAQGGAWVVNVASSLVSAATAASPPTRARRRMINLTRTARARAGAARHPVTPSAPG